MTEAASEQERVVVRLKGVSYTGRGEWPVLREVNLTIRRGEIYALLGGHGAGKTTTLDLVAGLLRPDAGRVQVLGADPAIDPLKVRRQLTFISGNHGLHEHLSPVQNVRFFAALTGHSIRATRAEATRVLRELEVPDRYMHEPMRGIPRSVGASTQLAIAVVRNAAIVLLDDPTLGFDSRAASGFHRSLRVVVQRGATMLLATSDVVLAGGLADRTGILLQGQLTVQHDRARWLDRSVMELCREYLGDAGPFNGEALQRGPGLVATP